MPSVVHNSTRTTESKSNKSLCAVRELDAVPIGHDAHELRLLARAQTADLIALRGRARPDDHARGHVVVPTDDVGERSRREEHGAERQQEVPDHWRPAGRARTYPHQSTALNHPCTTRRAAPGLDAIISSRRTTVSTMSPRASAVVISFLVPRAAPAFVIQGSHVTATSTVPAAIALPALSPSRSRISMSLGLGSELR